MDVLHATVLVVIISLVTTASEHMTAENKFICAPKSRGLPVRPYHIARMCADGTRVTKRVQTGN